MNVNEYININFETQNEISSSSGSSCFDTSATDSSSFNSSLNNTVNSSVSSSSSCSINDSITYDSKNNNSLTSSLFSNRHDYYKLELLKTNMDNFKLNLLLNEIKSEMNSLIDNIKSDLTIDIQLKMTELVYEQTLLNAKFMALQCCLSNKDIIQMVYFLFVLFLRWLIFILYF